MGWPGTIWQGWTGSQLLVALVGSMNLCGELTMAFYGHLCVCVFIISCGISGFSRWGRLIRPDPSYNSLAAYSNVCTEPWLSPLPSPTSPGSSGVQLTRVPVTWPIHTPESSKTRSDKSARSPRLPAIAELVRTLLLLAQLVASSLLRQTPSFRLRLGPLRHAGLARLVPRCTFLVSRHPLSHPSRQDWGIFIAGVGLTPCP